MATLLGIIALVLAVYVICTRPTRKELRYLLSDEAQDRKQRMRRALGRLIGRRCSITATPMACTDWATIVTGKVRDVDERYVLLEAEQKHGDPRLIALLLDAIAAIEEQA